MLLFVAVPDFAQQPNILLVIADDLGLDPVPNYMPGPTKATMPNLESLMAQGLTFDNVWVNPLCAPTRATIISGKYGVTTGVLNVEEQSTLSLSETTLFEYLQQQNSGYAMSLIGKWHLGGQMSPLTDPNDQGVPHYTGLLAGGVQSYFNWTQTTEGAQVTNTSYITRVLTDSALTWMDRQTQPWFCWLAYTAPHSPLHRPPLSMHNQGPLPTDPDSISANPQPYFLAMVESVDHELGRILTTLPADVVANTVILFIGDNGTEEPVLQASYPSGHGKGSLYEGGVRVPLVIAGPGVTRQNEREDALVNGTDLFATIAEITGLSLPEYEQSKSLVPVFTQSNVEHRSCLRTEVSGPPSGGIAFRGVRYKVITNSDSTQEFYDLQEDPYELNDLLAGSLTAAEEQALSDLLTGCDIASGVPSPTVTRLGLFPVPTSDVLHIQDAGSKACDIFSMDGRWVGARSIRNGCIDVSALASGGYSIVTEHGRGLFIKVD